MRKLVLAEHKLVAGATCLYPNPRSSHQYHVELSGLDVFTWGVRNDLVLRFQQHDVFVFSQSNDFVQLRLTPSNWAQYGIQNIDESESHFIISFME